MDIILYQNKADNHRVDKTNYLINVATISGTMRTSGSVIGMTIEFQSDIVPSFNYVYIPIFNRYYFVTDMRFINNLLWEIDIEVDVLMSFKDGILELHAFVDRCENDYNSSIIDKKMIVEEGIDVEDIEIPNSEFVEDFSGTMADEQYVFVISGYNFSMVENS